MNAAQANTELWTSFASLLRSYCAAHGLNSTHQAVVEVSADSITLRVADHWTRIHQTNGTGTLASNDAAPVAFHLHHDGTVGLANAAPQPMDMAAEQIARELMTAKVAA